MCDKINEEKTALSHLASGKEILVQEAFQCEFEEVFESSNDEDENQKLEENSAESIAKIYCKKFRCMIPVNIIWNQYKIVKGK